MRAETKHIRNILKKAFPGNNFKLLYKEAYSCYHSSDKLLITVDSEEIADSVISLLEKNTNDIAIYKRGEIRTVGGDRYPEIKTIEGDWVDADILEFIEVRIA